MAVPVIKWIGDRFNTQPRGGGCTAHVGELARPSRFQHTAARRRLHAFDYYVSTGEYVSTHSRAEAAA